MALAGFGAGWVDAVVGGGGLVQLPALLLGFPAASPAQLLATNKVSSIFGTTTSAVTYWRRVRPDHGGGGLPRRGRRGPSRAAHPQGRVQPGHPGDARRGGWLHRGAPVVGA